MDNTNKWLDYLIKERKLSAKVIQDAKLHEKDGWLAIPIRTSDGTTLFHKYRRAPWMPDSLPKYKYELGSKVTLFGLDQVHHLPDVFICEGELDVLTLRTCGYSAVSTTGGAGTFRPEWIAYISDKRFYLWYDNDEAGIKGAVKVALMLKEFTYVWTPPAWGKDANDLLVNKGKGKVHEAIKNGIEIHIPDLSKKTTVKDYRRELGQLANSMTAGSQAAKFLRALIVELSVMLASNPKKSTHLAGDGTLERAKSYQITDLLEVRNGFATHCPFHNPQRRPENSPSFKVYANNTAYCFGGCARAYDSIDIYRVLHNLPDNKEGFREALKRMTS